MLVLIPAILLVAGVTLVHSSSVLSLMPTGPDDVFYWQQGRAFGTAGFDSGYFVAADEPPLAEWSRFFAWGVVTPIFYGVVGRIVGWPLYAVPLLHAALLTAALGVWVWAVRPTRRQALTAAALIALYPPILLFSPTTMQEGFQQSLAIFAAAGFIALWKHPQRRAVVWGLGALLIIMSLAKVTWAVLFVPYLWMVAPPKTVRQGIVVLLGAGVLAVLAALWHRWTAGPYPYSIGNVGQVGLIGILLERISANFNGLVVGHPLELHMRALAPLVTAACLVVGVRRWRDPAARDVQTVGFLLLATIGLIFLLYEVRFFRDYRVIASPLLMALMVLCATRPRWVWPVIAACVLILPVSIEYYRETTAQHVAPDVRAQYEEWLPIWQEYAPYRPDAPSGWCNTVLVAPYYLFIGEGMLMALPAGTGISLFTLEGVFTFPAKSAYVLLSDELEPMVSWQMRLEYLRDAPEGALYRNLDAPCGG